MKKKTVAKLKVTRKLEGILPAFLCWFAYHGITIKEVTLTATPSPYTPPSINRIISAIFQIYRRFLHLYQRFSLYRRFDTGYRFTDIFRQSIFIYIPPLGIRNETCAPPLTSLFSTSILPPCFSTIVLAIYNPSPKCSLLPARD